MPGVAYVDSSAIVKTIVKEPESTALRRQLRHHAAHVSSGLARTEVIRAIRGVEIRAIPRVHEALSKLTLVEVTASLLESAGEIDPVSVRSLDAIHLATAMLLIDSLDVLITYDSRMAAAAESLGLPVVAPS